MVTKMSLLRLQRNMHNMDIESHSVYYLEGVITYEYFQITDYYKVVMHRKPIYRIKGLRPFANEGPRIYGDLS